MIEPKNNDTKLLHAFNKHHPTELVAKFKSGQAYFERKKSMTRSRIDRVVEEVAVGVDSC